MNIIAFFVGVGCQGDLPSSITALRGCTFLELNWNLIAGTLPRGLGDLDNLLILDLSSNLLTGKLDENSFLSLKKLEKLNLSFNRYYSDLRFHFYTLFINASIFVLFYFLFLGLKEKYQMYLNHMSLW